MTTTLCNHHDLIAREAVDQLAAAVQTILQLEELLKAARPGLGEHTAPARLIELGIYAAGDQANGFDCAREDLLKRLQECAPQKTSTPVRGAGGAA
ncbi:hypothetical protein [Pseudomonas fluorescens]|jgi:hypothetical protein|uniref:hypothetical protein n=1 Tax=Pseudomonas fluorescens TaxID=294 RepID=UPI0020C416A3|nr:hypothetical protein [Pseudomonas fluorescens]UTL92441.1 hypothetical protein NLL86_06820 [Pseudomonas fluorescens]